MDIHNTDVFIPHSAYPFTTHSDVAISSSSGKTTTAPSASASTATRSLLARYIRNDTRIPPIGGLKFPEQIKRQKLAEDSQKVRVNAEKNIYLTTLTKFFRNELISSNEYNISVSLRNPPLRLMPYGFIGIFLVVPLSSYLSGLHLIAIESISIGSILVHLLIGIITRGVIQLEILQEGIAKHFLGFCLYLVILSFVLHGVIFGGTFGEASAFALGICVHLNFVGEITKQGGDKQVVVKLDTEDDINNYIKANVN